MRPPVKSKIFLISFNKCETATFHRFFEANGIKSRHHGSNNPRRNLSLNIYRNFLLGRDPLTNINEFEAYTDLNFVNEEIVIEGARFFEYLHRHYPDAYFILATRDVDRWVASRMSHGRGDFARRFATFLKLDDFDALKDIWRTQFLAHNSAVRRYFGERPGARFLDFPLETGTAEEVAEFLKPDFVTDPALFKTQNQTSANVFKAARKALDRY
jgi:hypothetical protein